ncbi:MAG TPA: hypothetical protein VK841_02560 [Polyangiaceae bacterium]|jgi:hypothetical protein|nr:hypothetical protein [Polyangiaceae bacterium]
MGTDRAADDVALPPRPRRYVGMADAVTSEERRRALEAMAFDADPAKRRLEPMLLGTVGLASIDPPGERYEGEGNELAVVIAREAADHAFETRVLAQAAIEVWSVGSEGSAASRTALLRATGAFLLHDAATWIALGTRVTNPSGGTEAPRDPSSGQAPPVAVEPSGREDEEPQKNK